MDWVKQNAIAVISAIVAGSVTYGALSSDVEQMKQQQGKVERYNDLVVELRSEVYHVKQDISESKEIWTKLNDTLTTLNITLSVQGNEIKSVKEEVQEIKKAILK